MLRRILFPISALGALVAASLWLRPAPFLLAISDELAYRNWGIDFAHTRPSASWGPLYTFQYWIEFLVMGGDLYALAFLHWTVLLSGSLAVFWVMFRAAGLGPWLTLGLVAGLSLLSWGNQSIHVNLMAMVIIGGSLAIALRRPTLREGLAWLTGGAVLATFARPEFAYSAAGLLVAAVWFGSRRALLPVAGLAVALGLAFGVPSGGERSWMAFWQHYGNNVSEKQGQPTPTYGRQQGLFAADFGTASSLSTAVKKNPTAVLWHLRVNAEKFLEVPGGLLSADKALDGVLVASPILWSWLHEVFPVLPILLFAVGLFLMGLHVRRTDWRVWLSLMSVATTALPVVASGLLVAPEPRYFLPLLPPLMMLATWGALAARRARPPAPALAPVPAVATAPGPTR
jgi:hypothetical protein